MAALATQMRSDKDKDESSAPHEVAETSPGSSPESVFQSIEAPIGNIPHANEPEENLRLEDKNDAEVVVENAAIGENQQIEHIMEEQHDHHVITDPNSVVITQEDIYEAGFVVDNVDNLTDEQISILIGISERRLAKQNAQVIGEEVVEETHEHHEMNINAQDFVQDENSVAIILTEDGGLKITDHTQQEFYFSPAQLEEMNVNVNNLSEENVQQLVQMAIPSISLKHDEHHLHEDPKDVESNEYAPEEMPSTSYHGKNQLEEESCPSLINQTVHIRMQDGRLEKAVVRYTRGDSEYKIQFVDGGDFAYATLDQLILDPQGVEDNRSYASSSSSHRPGISRLAVTKRPIASSSNLHEHDEMCPPVLKRSYHLVPAVGTTHVQHAPNFCCPICDKKVYQKEPSYIVIRLPACDSCTREKIIVLDDQST